jgi:hypothetical protein
MCIVGLAYLLNISNCYLNLTDENVSKHSMFTNTDWKLNETLQNTMYCIRKTDIT